MQKRTVSTNPFLAEGTIRVLTKAGEQVDYTKQYFLEADAKTHLYHDHLLEIIPQLSTGAIKLLLFIGLKLRWNQDKVELDREGFLRWVDSSAIQSFYNARKDLEAMGVIAKAGGNSYWINPFLIFRGNRIAYAQQHGILNIIRSKQEPLTDEPHERD